MRRLIISHTVMDLLIALHSNENAVAEGRLRCKLLTKPAGDSEKFVCQRTAK